MTSDSSVGAVAAIIAAFNPEPALLQAVRALAAQISRIVVVDDGSDARSHDVLMELATIEGVVVIRQITNSGIAAALNTGVRHAASSWAPSFFLTLDQDSVVCDDYVARAKETYNAAEATGINIGFVTAASYSGHNVPVLFRSGKFAHGFDPMQSGFFIPQSTVTKIGLFEEGFFIDGVDSEYTMRARSMGLSVILGIGCTIEHSLGQRSEAAFFGRPLRVLGRSITYNYHSPLRVYYIVRNGTVLTQRYLRRQPWWVTRRLIEEVKAHTLRLSFSPNRMKLVRAGMRGFLDALRGQTGRISAELENQLR